LRPLTSALILEQQSFRSQLLEALKILPVRIVLDQGGFGSWPVVREKLERLQPDVLLMDLADQAEQRFTYIQQVRALASAPAVIVFHDNDDSKLILQAMRAGAAEFLSLPLEAGALGAALVRISKLATVGQGLKDGGGRLLAFLAAKGGAGATTLACNVSSIMGQSAGLQVLLADLDMETGNVAFAMKASSQYSIIEACRNINRLDMHYWKGLVSNGLPGLKILTAPAELRGVEVPQGVEVRQVLRFARTIHDYSVVDLPSSLNRLTMAVLEDADQVFLITTSDLPSLHLAKRTLHTLLQAGYPPGKLGLVMNRTSRRDEVTPEDIARNLGQPVYWSFPDDPENVTDFYIRGGTLSPQSELGKSIRQFIQKLSPETTTTPVPPQKKKSFLGL